jgi:hypothetical protein
MELNHFVRDSVINRHNWVSGRGTFLTIFLTKSLSIHDSTKRFSTFSTLPIGHVGVNVGRGAAVGMPQPISDNMELLTSF